MEMLLSSVMLGTITLSFGAIYGVASHHMIQETNSTLSQNDASFAIEHMKRHLMVATALGVRTAGPFLDDAGHPIDDYPVDNINRSAVNFYAGPLGTRRWQRYAVEPDLQGQLELRYYSDWVGSPTLSEVICRGVISPTPPTLFHRPRTSEVQIVLQTQRSGGGSVWNSTMETTVNLRAIPVNS